MKLYNKVYGDKINIKIQVSDKYPKKKYDALIYNNDNQVVKKVSFGDPEFESFETHGDPKRKELYIGRRSKMEQKYHSDYTMPSFYSLRVLWNKPTISESLKDIMQKFPNLNIFV